MFGHSAVRLCTASLSRSTAVASVHRWSTVGRAHADVALVLNEAGPICQQMPDESKEDMVDRGVQQLVRKLVIERQQEDEDSEFSD
jgi:hypothetical protein